MAYPFFSIIIPCYNQEHFLKECVTSVLAQCFHDWELIIVNDGSTDDTLKTAEKYLHSDSRIKVVNKVNGGLSSARNAGMSVAQGRILQFLDADDFLLSNCLKIVHDSLNNEPIETALSVGYQYVADKNTRVIHQVSPVKRDSYIPEIFTHNLGPCHSIFIHNEFAKLIGDFDESLKSAEDWDFWIRAAKAGALIKTIPDVLVSYRYVSNSMSRDAFRMYEYQKLVMLRGPKEDSRILNFSRLNIDRDVSVAKGIKKQLLMCLGVAVMQGKVEESLALLKKETELYALDIVPVDFQYMYSYLSFRYWNSKEDLERIISEFYPRFKEFFSKTGLIERDQRLALDSIFIPVRQLYNHRKYGKIAGGIINTLQRLR